MINYSEKNVRKLSRTQFLTPFENAALYDRIESRNNSQLNSKSADRLAVVAVAKEKQ